MKEGTIMLETYTIISKHSFEDTIAKLKESLMLSGFGTLCAISLNERFAAKQLSYDDQLMILEICNPFEAYNALLVDPNIIYFLPCKIVVKANKEGVTASMISPTALIELIGHTHLNAFAVNIQTALEKAMNSLSS